MNPNIALIIEDDPNVRLGCEQAMMLADIPAEGVRSAEEGLQVHIGGWTRALPRHDQFGRLAGHLPVYQE